MRKISILVLTLMPLLTFAQNHQHIADSAALIVDRFLGMTDFHSLPTDSMIAARTVATIFGEDDSVVMYRWYANPQQHRIELRYHDTLVTAFYGNGLDRFRTYDTATHQWVDIPLHTYYRLLLAYDLRGLLHNWKAHNTRLSYLGKATTEKGAIVDVVLVDPVENFSRYYMFEPSGLLTAIIEKDASDDPSLEDYTNHIEWKVIHEYIPLGQYVTPSLESFLRDGKVNILRTSASVVAYDSHLFNHDR